MACRCCRFKVFVVAVDAVDVGAAVNAVAVALAVAVADTVAVVV